MLTTISTMDIEPAPAPKKIQVIPVKDVWKEYFDKKYSSAIDEACQSLFAGMAPDYIHICGLSLIAQNKVAEGLQLLKTSLLLFPNLASWFSNASIAALTAKAFPEALEFSQAGLQRHNDAVLHFTHGNALMALNKLDESQTAFLKALQVNPNLLDALINLGNVLRRKGQSDKALAVYNKVLSQDANNLLTLINRAGVLMELNEHDEAAMILLRLMAVSEMPEVSFMMSMLRFIDGDLATGFDLYRNRFDCAMAAPDKAMFRKPMISSLEETKTKHVLVSHEQGFGDSLQFIRYLPMIAEKAKKVTLLIPKTLFRLFSSIDPRIAISDNRDKINYDLECPMLYLPYLFGTTLETIPNKIPYLSVPKELIQKHKLPSVPFKRVGVVWAGQRRTDPDLIAVDQRRSIDYKDFETIIGTPNIDFISLQLGDPVTQMIEQGTKGHQRPTQVLDSSMDFLDTAAIVMQLDLVVTVDTAIVHLAAALGKPVWMLSRFDQCWRWMKNRDDSPWYPGMLRIFHQKIRNDWTPVIQEVKNELIKWNNK